MSLFDNSLYRWRETYFIFHQLARRPTVQEVSDALSGLNQRVELQDLNADDDGKFDSVTIIAPDAYAAIDINYVSGEEVAEQLVTLHEELKASAAGDEERDKVAQVAECDARLDLLHFEQAVELDEADDEFGSSFDPGALITVLEALTEVTDGVGVDPASASVM